MAERKSVPDIRFAGFGGGWERRRAADLAEYSKGQGYSKSDLAESGTPIILYGRLYTRYKFLIDDVDTFAVAKSGSVFSQGGEVIVPASGETADDIARASAVAKPGILLGGDLNILRPVEQMNPVFLAISLSNGESREELARKAQGKSVVHIHNSDIQEISVSFPSRAEQDRIVDGFMRLDDLIESMQHKLAALANFKKAMLDKMFPKDGAAVPEIRFTGFGGDWERRKLGEFSDIKTGPFGSTLHADDYINDGIPIITTEHFKSGQLPAVKNGIPQVSDNDYSRLSSYILNSGDIVFSRVGSVDINALVTILQDKWLFSGRVLRVRPCAEIDSMFLHTLLETDDVRNDIIARAVGQTMPSINTEILKITSLCLPRDIDEQRKIGEFFHRIENLITLHQRKLDCLRNIKEACLEKMFV